MGTQSQLEALNTKANLLVSNVAIDASVAKEATSTAIKAKTDLIGASVGTSTLTQAQIISDASPFAGANVAAIKTKTDLIGASVALESTGNLPAVKAKTDLIPADITTQLDTNIPAIKTMTDKVGTVTNTGGTASIGAILGDFANSSLVTRVAAIPTTVMRGTDNAATATGLAAVEASQVTSRAVINNIHDTDLPAVKADTSANSTAVTALENKFKAAPSVDSILLKSGGAVCPTAKSIWDALGDGTNLLTGSKGLQQNYDLTAAILNLTRVGGTITTDGTEQNLYISDAPAGIIAPSKILIDTTTHTATETVVINIYYRLKSGGAYVLFKTYSLAAVQTPLGVCYDLTPNLYGVKVTINKTAGTNRTYDFEVYSGD